MTESVRIVTAQFHRRQRRGRAELVLGPKPPPPPTVIRPARVAYMLAFAHRVIGEIEGGVYANQAAAAEAHGLSRARMSQLLDLTLLPPAVQEELLFLESVDGREPVAERDYREMARARGWDDRVIVRKK